MSQSDAFTALYKRFEHILKRNDFLANKRRAEADWKAFANSLGASFFEEVRQSGKAATLIKEPPRSLMAEDLTWQPEVPAPIENVVDLFQRGVCQVRNNFIHGEKYTGSPDDQARDEVLISESLWVLRLASERAPNLKI